MKYFSEKIRKFVDDVSILQERKQIFLSENMSREGTNRKEECLRKYILFQTKGFVVSIYYNIIIIEIRIFKV